MSDFATANGRVFRAAAPRLFIFLAGVSYPAFVGAVLLKDGLRVDWRSFLIGAAMMIPTTIILAGAASLLMPTRLTAEGIHAQSLWGTPVMCAGGTSRPCARSRCSTSIGCEFFPRRMTASPGWRCFNLPRRSSGANWNGSPRPAARCWSIWTDKAIYDLRYTIDAPDGFWGHEKHDDPGEDVGAFLIDAAGVREQLRLRRNASFSCLEKGSCWSCWARCW